MTTINDRIRELRTHLNLSQATFGARVGLSRDEVKNLEYGKTLPREITIPLICREYGVREEWLRTGEGEMLAEHPGQKKIAAFLGDLMREEADGDFRAQLIGALADLTPEEWALLEQIARRITGG